MSEDDVDMMAVDGQGSSKVDRDRRAPRFSWTPAYEATFFRSLCESVQLGLRENSSFKAEAWERAAQALQESHGASPTKNHLINKSDNARKRFRLWRGLREDPDFVYNSKARTVTATEEAWRAHIEREPLSRALRGRPFDHEDYMETLYPDVIGSGGAPKRIMKPKRRDGQIGDDSELVGANTSIVSTDQTAVGQQSVLDSPGAQSANLVVAQPGATTPSTAVTSTAAQGSALTPPEDPTILSKKRTLANTDVENSLSVSNTPSRLDTSQAGSPEKRIRFSASEDAGLSVTAASTTFSTPQATGGMGRSSADADSGSLRGMQDLLGSLAGSSSAQWREKAVDLFYRDFSAEELDLQENNKLAHFHNTSNHKFTMSYAKAASKGPKQSPSEAAAPPPPELEHNESASTASLIDVDMPSVHTVPSDFMEQDVQTDTQAHRIEREADAAKAKAERARKEAAAKAKKADSWITKQVSQLSDGAASGVALANLATFVGVGSYLGYKAWNLYERGNLDGKTVGVGVGILGAVGAAQAVVGSYLYRGKKN